MFIETVVETGTKEQTYTVDESRWPAAGNGSKRFITPAPTPAVINWDLRPKGDPGHPEGAAKRDEHRLMRLEESGIAADGPEAFEGSGIVVVYENGRPVERIAIAGVPIPMNEMIRHNPKAPGVVTPLWPEGQALFFLGDNQSKEQQE